MKKSILFIISIVAILSSVWAYATVTDYTEAPCADYGITSPTDQCFRGATVYQSGTYGTVDITDKLINYTNHDIVWYPTDPEWNAWFTYDAQTLQSGTRWYLDDNLFYFPPSITDWQWSTSGLPFRGWTPNQEKLLVQSKPGLGLRFLEASTGADRTKPAFRLTFTTRNFNILTRADGSRYRDKTNPVIHKEHTFFYPAWCGDGVMDAKFGETCDAGTENGKPGQCNTSCNGNTPSSPVAGACGGADSTATATIPTANLCTSGVATAAILANGTYSWSCTGQNGGTTASCAAPQKTDAMCGTDAGKVMSTLPTNLCSIGTATSVSGVGPWSWSCTGQNGGATASCAASSIPPPPPPACDQYFTGSLRLGNTYAFPDKYINGNTYPHILDSYAVDFIESDDLNGDGKKSWWNFIWSNGMAPGVQIPANTTAKIIEASPRFAVNTIPASGRKSDNLKIRFTINTATPTESATPHIECINYAVTWCGDGVIDTDRAETCDAGAKNGQPGKCNVACNGTTPPPESPICSTSVTGPQTAPLTTGACNKGTVSGFLATDLGNAVNYTWSCNNSTAPAMNCSASYQKPIEKPFAIKLKKYVDNDTQDAQPGNEIAMSAGQAFSYVIRVTNLGEWTVKSTTTVADTLPTGVELNGNISGSLWTCKVTGRTIACTTEATPGANTSFADIIVPVKVVATTGTIINTAVVANVNDSNGPADNTDPAVIKIGSTAPSLLIKKYAKSITNEGDSQTAPISIARGETFNYYYTLENISDTAAKEVIVKDTLPEYLTFTGNILVQDPSGADVTGDWTCTKWAYQTTTRPTLVCQKKSDLPAKSGKYKFTVPVTLSASAPLGNNMQNVVYACAKDMTGNPLGPDGKPVCGTIDPPPPPPPEQCDKTNPESQKDPACIKVEEWFDLSIKKYVGTDATDAQPGSAYSTTNGATLNYVIRVKNEGTGSTSGLTTVKDILPTGISATGTVTGAGWTCAYASMNSGALTCTTSAVVASGATFPDITVPVVVKAIAGTSVTNYALVHNPSETNPCSTDNSMPSGSEGNCAKDLKNVDPAVISVSGGGCTSNCGTTTTTYYVPKCVNNIWSNATSVNETLALCNDANTPYTCQTTKDSREGQSCSTWPGTSCVPGRDPECTTSTNGTCGDGVLTRVTQTMKNNYDLRCPAITVQVGEECDLGNANSDVPGSVCSTSCKLWSTTHPGANPITSLSISLPTLGKIGWSTLHKDVGFTENKVVVGKGSSIFTLGDIVNFNITTQFDIPLIFPTDKQFCLQSMGNGVTPNVICNPANRYTASTQISGTDQIVLGAGTYQELNSYPGCMTNGAQFIQKTVDHPKGSMMLFKGADLTQIPSGGRVTPRDAFKGLDAGTSGFIVLSNISSVDNVTPIDMAKFEVRVSGAMLGSTASTTNRKIESYLVKSDEVLARFLSGFSGVIKGSSTTTSANAGNNTSVKIPVVINAPGTSVTGGKTVHSVAELEAYAVNGNKNILAVKDGNLNINCLSDVTPTSSTSIMLEGVRTVIVENGDLNINCNLGYSDSAASWAFIVKNGNIVVNGGTTTVPNSGVAYMAGVYVAIGDNTNTGVFKGTQATNTILRVEGSVYGNPEDLFKKRLYVRGTSAYDILTTGVILTYSNRALVNPPPLLLEYLNNYSVTKVAK